MGGKHERHQSGQILLITLLVVSVAVTIVLSVIGRATTDVAISNQIAESSRAFNAAEAGIEEALKTGMGVSSPNFGGKSDISYNVTRADIGGASGLFEFPNKTSRGQTETLWLANQDETNPFNGASFDLCWSSETTTPAMTVAVLYKTSLGEYRVARAAYDPDATRGATNNFSAVTTQTGGCGGSTQTTYLVTVSFAGLGIGGGSTLLAARITPVYSDSKIAILTTSPLPLQGSRLESTGTLASGVTRKIVVFQQYKAAPSIFDYVIYSQSDFAH